MKLQIPSVLQQAVKHCIIYSQEIVLGLAWLAFAVSSNAPLTNILDVEYPSVSMLFHIGYAIAGILVLAAVVRPKYFVPVWVFSAATALSAHLATVTLTEDSEYSYLYPITWGLFFIVSSTQAARHYWFDTYAD